MIMRYMYMLIHINVSSNNKICLPLSVYGTTGIMGKDVLMVIEATKAFYSVDHSQFDVEIPPVEWRDHLFSGTVEKPLKQKLRIGYYTDLGKITPTPGEVRSVLESVEILKVRFLREADICRSTLKVSHEQSEYSLSFLKFES